VHCPAFGLGEGFILFILEPQKIAFSNRLSNINYLQPVSFQLGIPIRVYSFQARQNSKFCLSVPELDNLGVITSLARVSAFFFILKKREPGSPVYFLPPRTGAPSIKRGEPFRKLFLPG